MMLTETTKPMSRYDRFAERVYAIFLAVFWTEGLPHEDSERSCGHATEPRRADQDSQPAPKDPSPVGVQSLMPTDTPVRPAWFTRIAEIFKASGAVMVAPRDVSRDDPGCSCGHRFDTDMTAVRSLHEKNKK